METNKKFTIYWKHGTKSFVEGPTIEQAFTNAGYGAGAVTAIDWYDHGETSTHDWSIEQKKWIRKSPEASEMMRLREFEIKNLKGPVDACAAFMYKGYEISFSTIGISEGSCQHEVAVFKGYSYRWTEPEIKAHTVAEAIEYINTVTKGVENV